MSLASTTALTSGISKSASVATRSADKCPRRSRQSCQVALFTPPRPLNLAFVCCPTYGHSTIYPFDTHFRVTIFLLARFATIESLRKLVSKESCRLGTIAGGQPLREKEEQFRTPQ